MAEQEHITQFLHTVPMFQGLNERQLNRLAKRFKERSYTKGETIVTQGTLGIGLFIIEKGQVEAVREHSDGSKSTVNTLGSTDFFGELSLLDESPRTASVIAIDDTVCLVLTQLDLMSALQEDADIAIVMLKELAKRFRKLMENL